MTAVIDRTAGTWGTGRVKWGMTVDDAGYRHYTVTHRVYTTLDTDGPKTASQAVGLPRVGDHWNFPDAPQEEDVHAVCQYGATVSMYDQQEGEAVQFWDVEQKFTNKACASSGTTDPLQEPLKISGSFLNKSKEVVTSISPLDGSLKYCVSSSFELLHGPQVEFDFTMMKVVIEGNFSYFDLATLSSYVNTVNAETMWDCAPRTIKLSAAPWSRKVTVGELGEICEYFYTVSYEFDIDFDTWDKFPIDEGTKVLRGKWEAGTCASSPRYIASGDYKNPAHFMRARDCRDEATHFLLNGFGEPLEEGQAPVLVNLELNSKNTNYSGWAEQCGVRHYRGVNYFTGLALMFIPHMFPGNSGTLFIPGQL